MSRFMTPQEVADKYTQPNGEIVIPGHVRIKMPSHTSVFKRMADARKLTSDMTVVDNLEIRGGKIYVDGVETTTPPDGIKVG